jgi:hypothetical protein
VVRGRVVCVRRAPRLPLIRFASAGSKAHRGR